MKTVRLSLADPGTGHHSLLQLMPYTKVKCACDHALVVGDAGVARRLVRTQSMSHNEGGDWNASYCECLKYARTRVDKKESDM
jgi:hypothetical protein